MGRRGTYVPSHPLQAPGPPNPHPGQVLGTMFLPSWEPLPSPGELLMARLGSSLFSGYLCQGATRPPPAPGAFTL